MIYILYAFLGLTSWSLYACFPPWVHFTSRDCTASSLTVRGQVFFFQHAQAALNEMPAVTHFRSVGHGFERVSLRVMGVDAVTVAASRPMMAQHLRFFFNDRRACIQHLIWSCKTVVLCMQRQCPLSPGVWGSLHA